jgi:predicted  nucleic acid-binding Zn-ribbon protein
MNDALKKLRAELERQNDSLEAFEQALGNLGDVELAVPHAILEELDELTSPRNPNPMVPFFGIRG